MNTLTRRYTQTSEVTDLIGHDSIVSPTSVSHLDIVVKTDSARLEGSSVIHASVADVPNPLGVILMPVSWSDYGKRPFQEARLGSMADFSQMRVVGIDFPGMGDLDSKRKNEFTEKDYEDLKKGRLTGITKRYWDALQTAGLLKDANGEDLPVALWGHSLSTLTVAEMLANLPDGVEVTDAYFSEIMALDKRSRVLSAVKFMTQGSKDLEDYAKMNIGAPDMPSSGISGLVKQTVRQPRAHLKAHTVLTKGRHIEVVRSALQSGKINLDPEHGTRFHSINAENGLANPMSVALFSDELAKFGIKHTNLLNRRELKGEFHGYQDSFPAVLHQLTALAVYQAHNS